MNVAAGLRRVGLTGGFTGVIYDGLGGLSALWQAACEGVGCDHINDLVMESFTLDQVVHQLHDHATSTKE